MKSYNLFLRSALILSAIFNAKYTYAEFGSIDLSIYQGQSWTPDAGSEEYGTSNFWHYDYWNHTIDSDPDTPGIEGADCDANPALCCNEAGVCQGNIDTHGGIDFSLGGTGASGWIRSYGYAKCINIDDNRFNPISFQNLLNSGEVVTFNFVHSEDEKIKEDTYIAKYQLVSREGFAGTTHAHLHLEVADRVDLAYISTATAYPCPGDNNTQACVNLRNQRNYNELLKDSLIPHYDANSPVYYNPRAVASDYKELIPYLGSQQNPSPSSYDVFGRVNKELYSTIELHRVNPHEFNIIGVRQYSLSNQNALNRTSGVNPQWFMNESDKEINDDTPVHGSGTLDAGTYLFSAGVIKNKGDALAEGYPVLFEIVGENDIIIDNDQRDVGYSDAQSLPMDLTENVDIVPGYYLTAKLIKGTADYSTSWAKWAPGVAGEYSLSVYIPDGATAASVIYRIVPDGSDEDTFIETLPIDQSNGDRWIELSSATQENFNFTANGYVELLLSNDANPSISDDQYVAFDAVKFVYVSGNNEPETKISIGYEENKNARKPMVGDKVNISCYFKPSEDVKKDVEYSIRVGKTILNSKSTSDTEPSDTEPFVLTNEYPIQEQDSLTVSCYVGNKDVAHETIENIGSYNEPKNEGDIKDGDRVTVQSNPINVYTCSPSEKGFYTATLIGQAPIRLQGNIEEAFFTENGNVYRKIEWKKDSELTLSNNGTPIEWDKIAIGDNESLCIAGEDVSSLDNPCFFDDFLGKIISVKSDYVNCRDKLNKSHMDWSTQTVIPAGTFGFSKNNDSFNADGYTWYHVSWYNENGDTCYSAKAHINIDDINDTHYFESVGEMCKMGVVSGYGSLDNKFGPSNFLTRAEVSKIIVNTLKKIPSGTPVFDRTDDKYAENAGKMFGDVSADYELAKYIGKLSTSGVIKGYLDGDFGPNDNVSLGQLTKFIVNAILIDSSIEGWPDNCRTNASDSTDSEEDSAANWKNCINEFDTKCPKDKTPCPFDDADSYDFCRYLYKLKDTALPIYDGENFVNISSKDQAEKSATRGETMKAIYSSFLKRTQMSCDLLKDGKNYAESCTQN